MITPKALVICVLTAAQTYHVPPVARLGILAVEGGQITQAAIQKPADLARELSPSEKSVTPPSSCEVYDASPDQNIKKSEIYSGAETEPVSKGDNNSPQSSFGSLIAFALGIALFVWIDRKRSFNPKLLTDTARPEPQRRAELVQLLIRKGYIIQRQEPGIVLVMKQKPRFDMLGFIFLSFFFLLPGILYLIYYATRRDEIKQFMLVH